MVKASKTAANSYTASCTEQNLFNSIHKPPALLLVADLSALNR